MELIFVFYLIGCFLEFVNASSAFRHGYENWEWNAIVNFLQEPDITLRWPNIWKRIFEQSTTGVQNFMEHLEKLYDHQIIFTPDNIHSIVENSENVFIEKGTCNSNIVQLRFLSKFLQISDGTLTNFKNHMIDL